jgi:hypothetical protein
MPVSYIYRKILEQIHPPGTAVGTPIGTRRDEINFNVEIKLKRQEWQESETPFERADQNRVLILIVALDFRCQSDDALLESLLTDQYFQLVVDIRIRDVALPPILVPSSSAW